MRPQVLFPLFAPVTTLPGVGPKLGPLFERAAGAKVVDLLWHRPTGLVDRRFTPKVAQAPEGRIATIAVTIDRHEPPRSARLPYKVRCHDETDDLVLVFFHAKGDYLARALPVGEQRVVSGTVERYRGETQITHPDYIVRPEEMASLAAVEPVYRLTEGISAKVMLKAVRAAVERAPPLDEWLDPALCAREGWPSWQEAVRSLHAPAREEDMLPAVPARRRLAYDELLASQLALSLMRAHQRSLPGRRLAATGALRAKALAALPFALTPSQTAAIREIDADMEDGRRMLRLLQGDVGSGKTVVAFLAMLHAVEAGAQAALMAPTEILAQQHFATIAPLAEAAGVKVAVLTGRAKGKAREALLAGLREGSIPLAVGTHALVQEDVAFRELALAVVDEQHRFGVHDRLSLARKGDGLDVLVMTATPIPRTLMMCAYGDLDSSRLTEKPPGRQPIDTRTIPLVRLDEVVDAVARKLQAGEQAFWVCPMVEESEDIDIAAATRRHAELAARFGEQAVALVHGKLKAAAKDAAMERFANGQARILVATTVIEVGVDVPAATIMVIEHAERFGLAQLHQLRGRVGRGSKPSFCLLLFAEPLGEIARQRLSVLRETEDGFRIAEEDLRLRGAGEILGTRQSGFPEFRLADLSAHEDLLAIARDDARLILARGPELKDGRGPALRTLLYLFERDSAVRLIRSG